MKTILWGIRVAVWSCATLALTSLAAGTAIAQSPQVKVEATNDGGHVRILANATGPFEYTTYRPSDSLFVVDLAGVTASSPSGARVLRSDSVTSYRVMQYRSGEMGIVRIEVLLQGNAEPKIQRTAADSLAISFEGGNAKVAQAKTTTAAPAPASRQTNATMIQDVRVERTEQQTLVTVLGNGKLNYEAMRLSGPDRLVLDFTGTRTRPSQKTFGAENAPVMGIRTGQFKANVSRVVIDLASGMPYQVNPANNSIVVSFGPGQIAKQVQPAPAPENIEVSAPVAKAAEPQVEKPANPIAADAAALSLPANLTSNEANLAAPATKMVAEPEPAPPTPARGIPVANRAEPSSVPQPQGKFTGEPISVNFKDLDLKDFFRLIHEISGLNVVIDPNVRGTITIVLEDVPWDQALDIALRNNNLDKQVDGNVLRIATRATLKKEAEEKRDLAKAEAEAVTQETRTFTLSYAKAATLRDTFKRFLSSRGEILADDRSNSLIVKDIPAVFPDIINLMNQLDRKTQQVEIEARVVTASRAFAREVGTQFGFGTSATGGRNVFGGVLGFNSFVSPIERGPGLPPPPIVSSGSTAMPLNTNLGATAPNSGVSYAHSSPNFALDFILTAAESRGVGKLISKPKIFTQNNKKGMVQQGTKIPLQTVVNNTITVQYIDAVLKLEVTPQITAEGTVFLEVVVENTAIDDGIPRILGIPALTTQKAETNVIINDGGTVVIGGVIVSQQRTNVSQVPLLGSIPALGHLFKRTAISSESRELLFFLTPRIVPD